MPQTIPESSPPNEAPKGFATRLRARYILLAIGLALVPLALIALIMHRGLHDRLMEQSERVAESEMASVAQEVTNRFRRAGAQLRTLANVPPVAGILRAQEGFGTDEQEGLSEAVWVSRYVEIVAAMAANDHDIASVRLHGRNERILARADFRQGAPLPGESWQSIEAGDDPAYLNSFKLPAGGLYISTLQPRAGPARGPASQDVISFAMPIHVAGFPRAVLILDVVAQGLLGGVLARGGSDLHLLADIRGRYAVHTEISPEGPATSSGNVFQDWPGLDPRKLDIDQHSISRGRQLHARLMDVNPNGVASFWILGRTESDGTVQALLGDMGRLVLQWAIILGLIAISVALVMADLLSKPLRMLSDTARRVMAGSIEVRAPVLRKDEVGELALAFNNMLDSLQKSNQSLVDARVVAEEATRAKSAFLANMSHEVRTPMNGVLGMLELLSQTELDSRQRDYALTAKHSAEALLHVLDEILDLSKIEAGKLVIDKIAFDLRRLVEECVTLFSHRAQEKRVSLLCFIPADVPALVNGDPTRIRQIVMNLLSNAIKFTHTGEVSLALRVRNEPGDRCVVRFDIKDTGIGLTEEQLRGLFQPFAQADSSTTRNFGGTGLGLAICKRLVHLMNGEIGVDSRPAEGSLFWFEIPVRKADAVAAPSPAPQRLAGARILVVDDNLTNRLLIVQHLEAWHLHPVAVDGPGAALRALREAQANGQHYDLAVLDMQMPAMDGISLARTISEEFGARRPRFLLLSSLPQIDTAEAAAAGIEQCLSRPVDQARFLDAVARTMGVESPPLLTAVAPPRAGPLSARVLLVEDNLVNQQVALYNLRRMGLDVTVASNGRIALDTLATAPFDLVLMDCQMPEMDGFEATRAIRAMNFSAAGRPVPVIAMTANALEGDRERCLQAGMNDYLTKPFRQDQLRTIIERWLTSDAKRGETSDSV